MMNFNNCEINKFNKLAHHWWNKNGPFKMLHKVNPLRMEFINKYVNNIDDFKMIDIGCGGGILTESLAEKYHNSHITGIDVSYDSIEVAKLHLLNKKNNLNITYLNESIKTFINTNNVNHFDIITCMEMLEHVNNPLNIIKLSSMLLKQKGWLFCSTLNRNFKSYIFAIIIAEYILNIIPKNTHKYSKFIQPFEIIQYAQDQGLNPIEIKGITYNILTQTMSWTSSPDVNYIIAFQKTS